MINPIKNWKKSGKYIFSAQKFIDEEIRKNKELCGHFYITETTPETVIKKYRWILTADGKEVVLDTRGFGSIPDTRRDYKGQMIFISGRDCVTPEDYSPYSGPIPPEPPRALSNQVYHALQDLGFIPEDLPEGDEAGFLDQIEDELGKAYGNSESAPHRRPGRPSKKHSSSLAGISTHLIYDEPTNPFSIDALREEKERERNSNEDPDLPF